MLRICDLSYVPSHNTLVSSYLHLCTHTSRNALTTHTCIRLAVEWENGREIIRGYQPQGCDRGGQTVTPRSEPTHMWAYSKWKELSQQPGAVRGHVCVDHFCTFQMQYSIDLHTKVVQLKGFSSIQKRQCGLCTGTHTHTHRHNRLFKMQGFIIYVKVLRNPFPLKSSLWP